jgi:hypothetical protein
MGFRVQGSGFSVLDSRFAPFVVLFSAPAQNQNQNQNAEP